MFSIYNHKKAFLFRNSLLFYCSYDDENPTERAKTAGASHFCNDLCLLRDKRLDMSCQKLKM